MQLSRLRPLRLACFVLGAGLIAYAGCSNSGNTTTTVTHPTMLEVAPTQFLGAVPCAADGPGLKTYVATLYDTNQTGDGGAPGEFDEQLPEETTETAFARLRGETPSDEFELPSSAPAPCTASVGFGYVVPGRRYEVLIEGYEQDAQAVEPRAVGSHLLVERANPGGSVLKSSYRAYCRRAIPVDSTIVVTDHCDPFELGPDAPKPSLRVALGSLLGSLECGTDDGQVEALSVSVSVGDETVEQTVDCATDAQAVFEDLPTGVASVYVTGLLADGKVAAGATCDASLREGAQVTARCNRLSSVGTLRVNVAEALANVGLSCSSESVRAITVAVGAQDPGPLPLLDCAQSFETDAPAGNTTVTVAATPAAGGEIVTLSCPGEISPGKLTLAVCEVVTS